MTQYLSMSNPSNETIAEICSQKQIPYIAVYSSMSFVFGIVVCLIVSLIVKWTLRKCTQIRNHPIVRFIYVLCAMALPQHTTTHTTKNTSFVDKTVKENAAHASTDGIRSVNTPDTVVEEFELNELTREHDQSTLNGSDHSQTCTDVSDNASDNESDNESDNDSLGDSERPAFAKWAD